MALFLKPLTTRLLNNKHMKIFSRITSSETFWAIALQRLLLLFAACILTVVAGCDSGNKGVLQFGEKAPSFSSTDMNGTSIDLAELQGVPVVLRFFVPNCKYCRSDTKIFNEYFKKYSGKGLKIIYINTDKNLEEAQKFVKELDIVFPVILDRDQAIAELYRVKIVPQTIVLDPDHLIIGAILGGVSEAELDDLLLKFLQ